MSDLFWSRACRAIFERILANEGIAKRRFVSGADMKAVVSLARAKYIVHGLHETEKTPYGNPASSLSTTEEGRHAYAALTADEEKAPEEGSLSENDQVMLAQ